jgi:hypothetical protein
MFAQVAVATVKLPRRHCRQIEAGGQPRDFGRLTTNQTERLLRLMQLL